ncbi:MAG: signal peptide peptidase SppA [Myxococcota bacterium]
MGLLRILAFPFVLLVQLLRRPLLLRRKKRAAGKDGWVELELEGSVVEYRPAPEPWYRRMIPWRQEPRLVTLAGVERLVLELKGDPTVKGLVLRMSDATMSLRAAAQLRALMKELRATNKDVVAWIAHSAGNKEYILATAARQIWAMPAAILAPVGAASSGLFLKEALDRLGVRFEVRAAGKYKSAPDALTRVDRSDADREQTEAIIGAVDRTLVQAVSEGRGISEAEAIAKIDQAPASGARALEAGLVDALIYDEDVARTLSPQTEQKIPAELVDARDYLSARTIQPLFRGRKKWVGVVEVHGAIMEQAGPFSSATGGAVATEKAVVADLRAALAHPKVGAVVLHIDSRGGSVIASEAMYGMIRRLDEEKPVIACFGDVAASGGYYVACGARTIVASPLTITGSIGVFSMMPTWPELAARLGLHPDLLKNRLHAALYDPWRSPTEEERAHGQAEVEGMYEAFLAKVAAARKKTRDEVHAVAQGRVWMAEAAKEAGLVDGLGGFTEALERAKAEGKGTYERDPRLIRAKRPLPRPDPREEEMVPQKTWLQALGLLPPGERALIGEILALLGSAPAERRVFHWAPVPRP